MASAFDAATFLDMEVEDLVLDTKYTPVPSGDDYLGIIHDIKLATPKESVILNVLWKLVGEPAERAKEAMEVEELPMVAQRIFLDVDPRTMALLRGKNQNVGLGALREALGQNTPQPWGFRMLKGAGPLRLKITVEQTSEGRSRNSVAYAAAP